MRDTEITARVSDIVISCSGGTPTPAGQAVPTRDFLVYFELNHTGRKTGDLLDSLLLVDDPPPQAQSPCATDVSLCGWTGGGKGPNVFQGKVLAPNAIAFYGIPVDPPGDFTQRTFRIVNPRLNVSSQWPSGSERPNPVMANVTASGLALQNANGLVVGYSYSLHQMQVRDAAGNALSTANNGIEVPNCTTVTKKRFATLRFSDFLGLSLLPPNWTYDPLTAAPGAPSSQAVPGTLYYTESGFYNPLFPQANHLNKAGLADSGTRLQATFTGLPAGAAIYVSTVGVTYANGVPSPSSNPALQARLTMAAEGAFAPVPATETLDGIPVAAVAINKGTASVVWEVTQATAWIQNDFDFPVWISFPGNAVGLGTTSVSLRLAPVSSETSASETAWIPRFADIPTTLPLLTTLNMCPATQYLVTTSPAFLPVTVDGQTFTSPKSFPWTPGSTHTISVAAAIPREAGVRYAATGWSDGGALTHTITVPPSPTTYVAAYKLQYLLDIKVVPAGGGTVSVEPASPDGYYDPAPFTDLKVSAVPGPLYSFTAFSGDLIGPYGYQLLRMTKPRSITATFLKAGPVSSTVGVSPASGSGSEALLTATYEGSQGFQSLKWVELLLATAPDGGGQPFCFVHFDAHAMSYWLYSDVDGFFHGPVTAGTPSADLQGSSCFLDTSSYQNSPNVNGPRLSVSAQLLFKTAGARNIYLRAMDEAGVDTGWVQQGTWTQQPAPPPSMSATRTSALGPYQYFQLSSSIGQHSYLSTAPVGWTQFLIAADPTGGGQPFCFVHYDRAGQELWMYSSDVGFFLGPVKPGNNSNLLQSSACNVDTSQSGPAGNSTSSFGLSLLLGLRPPMQGPKKLYMRSMDALKMDSGFQLVGTFQVP
ncbi:hypothetical protein [Paludibaculum fermentans]|uniref:hypothetical protein n=1 Tax=Paludibaculum fermentans TaxID=1473598 RepID=UPI003EBB3955